MDSDDGYGASSHGVPVKRLQLHFSEQVDI